MAQNTDAGNQVLVIGGGVAGMSAALDLAEQGHYVYLVEKTPSIGGKMSQLDKTFPTLDCSICILAPKMVECSRHPRINLLTYSQIDDVTPINEGSAFKVRITKKARYIDQNKCTGCGDCAAICPVRGVYNEYEVGLKGNHAASIPFLQAVPAKYVVSEDNCLYLNYGICKLCANNCQAEAVNFNEVQQELTIDVSSIIVATGFDLLDLSDLKKYGYGKYPNVVTSLEYERIMCASGPTKGEIVRPSDRKHPHKIALILCVGSRDQCQMPYCSKICCMYSTKEAIMTMEHSPDSEILIYFNDLRAIGKNHSEFIENAKNEYNVKYVKGIPNKIYEDPRTNNLKIRHTDVSTGDIKFESVDMAVLFPAVIPSRGTKDLSEKLGIELSEFGFIKPKSHISEIETTIPGIYTCGCAHGPEDISTSVAEASAAAALAAGRSTVTHAEEIKEEVEEKVVLPSDPLRIGVFICHCGSNIAGVVDVETVGQEIENVPDVVYVERNLYTCSEESQHSITAAIEEYDLNRVVIASCTPRTHLPLFQATSRKAGLNPYLVNFASIRELVSWVHMNQPKEATVKARDQILMEIAKSRLVEPLHDAEVDILPSTLVIGGGIAGMTSALAISKKGFKVYLVEKEDQLGGFLRTLRRINIQGVNTDEVIIPLINLINNDPNIGVFTSSTVKDVSGTLGNFIIDVSNNGTERKFEVGTVIVAVGGQEFKPNGYYQYNQNDHIYTNLEFEKEIKENKIKDGESIAFIQCVGSREKEGRTYCSLTCCTESIKNAIEVKEKNPNSQIYIIYRDVRVFFEDELNYRLAREMGINFIQYIPENPPILNPDESNLILDIHDSFVGVDYSLTLDKLVLATPLISWDENKRLSEMLKVPIDKHGFFLEAHAKLRPVDFATDGVFICGTAQSPKNVKETISQALGAAGRALIFLMKGKAVVEGITSYINQDVCIGCGRCVDVCPFNAIELIELDKQMGLYSNKVKKAQVISAICKGCGACVFECPVGAIDQKHFTKSEIKEMIDIMAKVCES